MVFKRFTVLTVWFCCETISNYCLAEFMVIDVFSNSQPYIVDATINDSDRHDGFERAGLPEGIPSQAEFIAEYCIASVR